MRLTMSEQDTIGFIFSSSLRLDQIHWKNKVCEGKKLLILKWVLLPKGGYDHAILGQGPLATLIYFSDSCMSLCNITCPRHVLKVLDERIERGRRKRTCLNCPLSSGLGKSKLFIPLDYWPKIVDNTKSSKMSRAHVHATSKFHPKK